VKLTTLFFSMQYFVVKISSSLVKIFAPGITSHLSPAGVASCGRFACVVSYDFPEFFWSSAHVFNFGVQFDPIDLEDFGFVGSGGSDF
jgi:hypothetical protein